MALTAVEIIALVFIIIALIKLIVIAINKKTWYTYVARPIYENAKISGLIFFILALIILYYLLQEFTIVQIFAVMAFVSLVIVLGFLEYAHEMEKMLKKLYHEKFTFWRVVYSLAWLVLLVWALIVILLR